MEATSTTGCSGSGVFRAVSASEAAQLDEAELVGRLTDNDPLAWRELEARYDALILATIGRTGRGFRLTADEIREIRAGFYFSLLTNGRARLRRFDVSRGTPLANYVTMLARNVTYDHLRARRRGARFELGEVDADTACDSPDPFEVTALREEASLLPALLGELTELEQQFAQLYFAEEREPCEIAARLDINVATVYSKRHKLTTKLRQLGRRRERAAGGDR